MSCSWQQTRAARALEHELNILGIAFTEDGDVVFHVDGVSDVYTVSINQEAALFCPDCDCNDSIFRGPDLRCKHVCHVLLALGLPLEDVEDPFYEPTQAELTGLLSNAPDVVSRGAWSDHAMALGSSQERRFAPADDSCHAALCTEDDVLVR